MEERRRNQPGRGERRKADAARIADALKRRGRISMYVQGTSMLPLVHPGDVALIRRDKLENMRSGDVVLFQRGNHLLAKRIGKSDLPADDGENSYCDSGENQENHAEQAEREECLGQIVRVHRNSEDIELSSKETPIAALVSRVLRPARWAKETLHLSDETTS
jgi:Peptidase S24-like